MDTPAAPPSAPTPSSPSTNAPQNSTPKVSNAPVANNPSGPDVYESKGTVPSKYASTQGQETPSTEAQEAKAEKKRRLLQLKVDGKQEQIDLDSMSDEQLAIELQMAKAARKRMQEAAELKKQVNMLFDQIKKGDFSILKDPSIGIDVRKMVEDQLIEEHKRKQLPPEEQRVMEIQKQAEEYKTKLEQYERERAEEAQRQLDDKVAKEITEEFSAALDSKDLPRTRETLALMAEIASEYVDKHGINLTPQQLASEVESRIQTQAKYVLSKMNPAALAKYLGDDVVRSLLKHSVEAYKAKQAFPAAGRQTAPGQPTTEFSQPEEDDPTIRTPSSVNRRQPKPNAIKTLTRLRRGL